MAIVIVETEPGTFIRLPEEEATRRGLKATEIKPFIPQKNKAIKPAKTKAAAPVVVTETTEQEEASE